LAFGVASGPAGGAQQRLREAAVGGGQAARALVAAEVVVPVRQAQAGLAQAEHVAAGVLAVGLHAVGQRRRDAAARQQRQQRGQVLAALQRVDAVQQRRDRGQTARLDGRLVHAAGVVGGDELEPRRRLQGRLVGQFLQRAVQQLVIGLAQLLEAADAGAAGGQLGRGFPGAVDVGIEVVAGRDVLGQAAQVEGRGGGGQAEQGGCGGQGVAGEAMHDGAMNGRGNGRLERPFLACAGRHRA
jgi:hypothetical protein